MLCPKCGQELAKGQTVCPACGAPVKNRGKRILLSTIFVIMFVLIVSAVLIFFNLKARGDLSELSFSHIHSLFVKDSAADSTPVPTELPKASAEPEPPATPEPTPEPEPSVTPEPTPEPAVTSEPTPEFVETAAAPAESAQSDTSAPTEAWRAAERESFETLRAAWSACREADENAPEALLRGDARLLLRLMLNTVLDGDMRARLLLDSTDGPESWSLFPRGDADAAFLPLLEREEFASLLDDYVELVLSSVETVSVGEETLEAEGVLERCPGSFRADLDGAALRRLASSLIGTLRWDERISRFLSAEDYMAFQIRLDELDYALETRGPAAGDVLHMILYVDEAGQVRGRSLELESAEHAFKLLFALPRDAEDLGLELRAAAGDSLHALTGRGVLTDDAFRGSFRLLRDGRAIAGITAELAE